MRDGADKKTDRNEYLVYALSQIDDNTVWSETEQELSGHIDDREEYFKDCGYDDEQAAQMAVERMGSPEAAADGFSKVYKSYRRITAIIAMIMSVLVILGFWFMANLNEDQSTMLFRNGEALILMYIIGISVLGKRRNSRFMCFAAIIDFILTYGFYFLHYISSSYAYVDEFCSRIVLKLACLFTLDFECLSAFSEIGRITVEPYLIYLSAAFFTAVFIILILVFVSVCILRKQTYSLKEKHFAKRMFKIQKGIWIFLFLTIFISSAPFDEKTDVTIKEPYHFDAVVIAQSDTPRPISEIPPKDIYVAIADWYGFHEPGDSHVYVSWFYDSTAEHYNKVVTCHGGDFIEKEFKNKLKYSIHRIYVPYSTTKENVYIEFLNYNTSDPKYKDIYNENVYQLVSDNSEYWYKTDSTSEISAAIDGRNQVEVLITKAE